MTSPQRLCRRSLLLGVGGLVLAPSTFGIAACGEINRENVVPTAEGVGELIPLLARSISEVLSNVNTDRRLILVLQDYGGIITTYSEIGSISELVTRPQIHVGRNLITYEGGVPSEGGNSLNFRATAPNGDSGKLTRIDGEIKFSEGSALTGAWSLEILKDCLDALDSSWAQLVLISSNLEELPSLGRTETARGVLYDERTDSLRSMTRIDAEGNYGEVSQGEYQDTLRDWSEGESRISSAFVAED